MEIPLINTYLKIDFDIKIRKVPKLEKVKKELSDYFDKHEISGIKIRDFRIDDKGVIWPDMKNMRFIEAYSGVNYEKEFERIAKKYCMKQLRFSLDCYGK